MGAAHDPRRSRSLSRSAKIRLHLLWANKWNPRRGLPHWEGGKVSIPTRLFEVGEPERVERGLFSSLTCEWPTPQALYDQLDAEFHFTLDPCSTDDNHKAPRYFTKADDGLMRSWEG